MPGQGQALPKLWALLLYAPLFFIRSCDGHGRLIEPPSRASAWRYGFQTPPDYNDHELYCGGFTRQWKRNGGKCGECGDAWDMPEPRPHENGGQWGQGVIVRSYLPASEMTIRVELTASHMGYFEFRLCDDPGAKQACLDKNILHILGGSPAHPSPADLDSRFYPRNGSRIYEIKARLPEMTCNQCVLQWRYVAGNNWGMCNDGNGAVGCGPQEEFRSCSDIAITTDARPPMRPIRPLHPTPTRPSTKIPTTNEYDSEENAFNYSLLLALVITLGVVFCAIGIWYFYRRNFCIFKECSNSVAQKFRNNNKNNASLENAVHNRIFKPLESLGYGGKGVEVDNPPVPPPRTKRDGRMRELSANASSVA
ncbi:GL12291 [Drosophila persimilis]|uniref:GL12291 n=1 Tax=Drosophila persimilis TaxID=7234 RepID=B4GM94_DROPE|nr:GL12291 [Drosophila persimilis]